MTLSNRQPYWGSPSQILLILILIQVSSLGAWSATYYVKNIVDGAVNGLNWTDAFDDLSSALAIAVTGDEIWVAQGVYVPGATRTDTFNIPPNVSLFGGFEGAPGTEGLFALRNPSQFPTILSGDIGGDDVDLDGNQIAETPGDIQGNNAFHVIRGIGLSKSTVLDGFTITAGFASALGDVDADGGGIQLSFSEALLSNLTIIGNRANGFGGGVSLQDSSPTFQDVLLSNNFAASAGGGMDVVQGSPLLRQTTFLENRTLGGGGGLSLFLSSPSILNTRFLGNSAGNGGAIQSTMESFPVLTNTLFVGNQVTEKGGGIQNLGSSSEIFQSTFFGNSAQGGGGAIDLSNGSLDMRNSIVWGNNPDSMTADQTSSATITTSLVENGCPAATFCFNEVVATGPSFVDAMGPDGMLGTLDDNLRLTQNSPVVDVGDNTLVPPNLITDLDGNPRVFNLIVDLGPYETHPPLPMIQPPKNVRAGGGEGSVRLVWDSNPEPYLSGYNVYRSLNPQMTPQNETLLNPGGILLNPSFVDHALDSFPTDAMLYYQVEAVGATQDLLLTARSDSVGVRLNEFVLYLPAIRASTTESPARYPISLLNARGVIEEGLELVLTYPDFLKDVSFERTALSENFEAISAEIHPASHQVRIFGPTFKGVPSPGVLNGEGSLFDLTFKVDPPTPPGTVGNITIDTFLSRFVTTGGNVVSPRVIGPQRIEVHNEFRRGDVDGDGVLSASDVVLAASFALGVPFSDLEFIAGELNADGLLDVADLNLIRSLFGVKKSGSSSSSSVVKGGVAGTYQVDLADTAFETIPGNVDMGVMMTPPEGEVGEMAGASMTIEYASDLLELDGVNLSGDSFDDLFYDQRDYSRHFKEGRVRIVVSSPLNKVVSGEFLKLNFKSKGTPVVSDTDVAPTTAKLSRSNGGDEDWEFAIQLLEGKVLFDGPTPTETPTFTEAVTATETPSMTTESPTPTATVEIPTETSTSTPTPTIDVDFCPDGKIDVQDLLKFLEAYQDQH